MSEAPKAMSKKDWSADQYSIFLNERTRPVHDLITQISPHIKSASPRVYDLGCGPGNSTSALLSTFPSARITGMDSSPDMLKKARVTCPDAEFEQGNLLTYQFGNRSEEQIDLVFSNAVFHWLRQSDRIATLQRIFAGLKEGGVLAFQMPDNYLEPSHRLMRDVATTPSKPWSKYFALAGVGDLSNTSRPDLDPIEAAGEYYDAFALQASHVNIWRTTYMHVLADAPAIVEWVKGTGLLPYLDCMAEDEQAKKEFLSEYERRLGGEYNLRTDGKVILEYPRLFVLAVRSGKE